MKPTDLNEEKVQVKNVLDQFARFWETHNLESLSAIFAHDPGMVNFGSDESEYFVGWENLREAIGKMLPALTGTKVVVRDQVIMMGLSGDVAWFSQFWDWDLKMDGKPVQMHGQRLTGVLEKRSGKWCMVQFHNSVPVTQ